MGLVGLILPLSLSYFSPISGAKIGNLDFREHFFRPDMRSAGRAVGIKLQLIAPQVVAMATKIRNLPRQIGRASCRERV